MAGLCDPADTALGSHPWASAAMFGCVSVRDGRLSLRVFVVEAAMVSLLSCGSGRRFVV